MKALFTLPFETMFKPGSYWSLHSLSKGPPPRREVR